MSAANETKPQRPTNWPTLKNGDRVTFSRKAAGAKAMGLYHAEVRDNGAKLVNIEEGRILLLADNSQTPHWEQSFKIFEIFRSVSTPTPAVSTCPGVRACDFPRHETEFQRACANAMSLRARLDTGACRVDGNAVHLSGHIGGFRPGNKKDKFSHMHLWQQSPRHADISFHNMLCHGDPDVAPRSTAKKCRNCQQTFEQLREIFSKKPPASGQQTPAAASTRRVHTNDDELSQKPVAAEQEVKSLESPDS